MDRFSSDSTQITGRTAFHALSLYVTQGERLFLCWPRSHIHTHLRSAWDRLLWWREGTAFTGKRGTTHLLLIERSHNNY